MGQMAPLGRSRVYALPWGIAWEPPAGKAMGPKLLTLLMDMGWEALGPRY